MPTTEQESQTTSSPGLPEPALVPFVVSVTGHRDLRPQDFDALRREVEAILAGFRERMPNTPVLMLSGLAEGADQFVAEIALAQGVTLVAVLPMPLDIYRTTMPEAAQQQMTKLLARSAIQIELPPGNRTREHLLASAETRSWAYEALALFLAKHGQAMIALWDGKDSKKLGGTASVVRYVKSGTGKGSPQEVEAGCGLVYHVMTPRMSGPAQSPEILTLRLGCEPQPLVDAESADNLEWEEFSKTTFAQVEKNFERFNREAARNAKQTGKARTQFMKDTTILSPFNRRLQTVYGMADAISVRANVERQFFLGSILTIAIAGTLFYGIYGEILDRFVSLWFSFSLFVIVAVVLHRTARVLRVEIRYLDARALAEALRVQFFWELAGIHQAVDQHYLSERRTELDWIRFALKNLWLMNREGRLAPSASTDCKTVLESWVEDQKNWYHHRARKQARIVHWGERVSRYSLLVAVAWSILVPTALLVPWHWHFLQPLNALRTPATGYKLLHIALAVPALVAAAWRLWIDQSGYEEQAREYRYMERQFQTKATELAGHLDQPEVVSRLLRDLGIEALKENGKWLLLHRQRPLEVMSSP